MCAIRHVALAAVVVCLMASVTFGDFTTGFEAPGYNGSAAGVQLTDILNGEVAAQQDWYCPAGDDYYVYTYADNPFGMTAVNPTGGAQFACGELPANSTTHARGQHDDALTPGMPVLYGFDFNVKSLLEDPTLAPFSNAGSVSPQPSGDNFISLFHRLGGDPPVNDPGVNYSYSINQIKDAAGADLGQQRISETLLEDHWYRSEMIVDFDTNLVTKITLTDLATSLDIVVLTPADWYLAGGATRTAGMPTSVRMFDFWAADNTNMMAFDNLTVQSVPEPATLCLLGALSVVSALRRRRRVA